MKIITLFIFVLIGVAGCQSISEIDREGIKKERIADEILSKVAKKLKQEYGLRPFGTMGRMLYDVQVLGLSFEYYKSVDIPEGRRLLINSVNELMFEINEDKRIHQYLCAYPFRPTNIQISIFLKTPEGGDLPHGQILILKAQDDYLEYVIDHPTTKRLTAIYEESFDEALARLADPSLPLVPYESNKNSSKEELSKVRQGISFVDGKGVIWHLDETGRWVADPRSMPKK